MTVYSVEDFKEYLRGKSNVVIDEFDEFIKECKLIIKLRSEAEKRFKNKKNPKPFLAKSSKGALPLEWQQIDAIMNYEDNGPEEDYFTKTAKDIIKEIEIILFSLRKVLVRTRELVPASRVQQIDSSSLKWLIKQPGRNIKEKAGIRQKVLAVTRKENYDTLENRVFKALLVLLSRESHKYLLMYGSRFPEHETVRIIKKVNRICKLAFTMHEIENISSLTGIPTPNYVLRQDKYYSKIWNAYMTIIEQNRLYISLWANKEELHKTINDLIVNIANHTNPFAKYYSQIWFNRIKKFNKFLDKPYYTNYKNDFELKNKQEQTNSEYAIIDLTGKFVKYDLLIYSRHENAKPYLQHYLKYNEKPCPEDFASLKKYPERAIYLSSILTHKNIEKKRKYLQDYFEQLHGEIGGNKWIILIPDNWDQNTQEEIIRACPLSRVNITLLWRSVAAVLGCVRKKFFLKKINSVAIVDFQQGTENLTSILSIINDGEYAIPQRKAYLRNINKYYFIFKDSFQEKQLYPINQNAFTKGLNFKVIDVNGLSNAVDEISSVDCVIVLGESSIEAQTRFKYKPLIFEKENSLTILGAKEYLRRLEKNQIPYFDELEELSIVYQTADEQIKYSLLVEHNEKFEGGKEYIGEINSDISIEKDTNIIKFFLNMGERSRTAPLKELNYTCKTTVDKQYILNLRPKITPGQGMAKVEVTSDFLTKPISLDFFGNMIDTDYTVEKLEREMQRSFPPDIPCVEASNELWYKYDILGVLEQFCKGKKHTDGEWFAKARQKYSNFNQIPSGGSPLEILRRENLFGNDPKKCLPKNINFDFDFLFRTLAQKYDRSTNNGDIIRLIAWTYQYDNPVFSRIKEKTIQRIYKNSSNDLLKPKSQEYTLCANLCHSQIELKRCFEAIHNALLNNVAPTNYMRLLYNLLQFNNDFLVDKITDGDAKCWNIVRCLVNYCDISASRQTGCALKAILYMLRRRRFDGKKFITREKQYEKYFWVRKELSSRLRFTDGKNYDYYNMVIHYLDGSGKIDGLPVGESD